jgi:hypothetical protein
MSTPNASKSVTVQLGKKEFVLTYNRFAEYHIATLPRPSSVRDLLDESKSYAALIQWVWASLTDKDRALYPRPEALVPLIDETNISELGAKFLESWYAAQPSEDDSPKADSSKTGPSPALSSN